MGAWIETIDNTRIKTCCLVAPYVGAWIETFRERLTRTRFKQVAPYVGAWIETPEAAAFAMDSPVAPYVGAWIETRKSKNI